MTREQQAGAVAVLVAFVAALLAYLAYDASVDPPPPFQPAEVRAGEDPGPPPTPDELRGD